MIKLRLPLKQIVVSQKFGLNYLDFYQKMGLNGHNGIDFVAKNGTDCYASHDGEVTYAGKDGDGGVSVTLTDKENHFKTIYYHLEKVTCKVGDIVKAGDLIGYCDNTGKYTTGSHLHFGLKELEDDNFNTKNYNNGYKGAIDPAPYFYATHTGQEIGNKDWDRSRCYHRYYRGRPKGGYWIERYRVVPALIKYLKRLPTNEEINACTYGGWDREALKNDAMYIIWSQLKKDEFLAGERPTNYSGM